MSFSGSWLLSVNVEDFLKYLQLSSIYRTCVRKMEIFFGQKIWPENLLPKKILKRSGVVEPYCIWFPLLRFQLDFLQNFPCFIYTTFPQRFSLIQKFSLFGTWPSLSYLFDPTILHLSNKENVLLVICNTITAFNGSIALWYFVKRAKQCLGKFLMYFWRHYHFGLNFINNDLRER